MRSPQPKSPVYLARASYRQRRLRDVVRILPLAGFLAWILPVMSGQVPASSAVGLYIFAGWTVLIVLCAFFNSRLTPEVNTPAGADADDDVMGA